MAASTRLGSSGSLGSGYSKNRNRELMFQPGEWAWSLEHQQVCRIVEMQDLWGHALSRMGTGQGRDRSYPGEPALRRFVCRRYPISRSPR